MVHKNNLWGKRLNSLKLINVFLEKIAHIITDVIFFKNVIKIIKRKLNLYYIIHAKNYERRVDYIDNLEVKKTAYILL